MFDSSGGNLTHQTSVNLPNIISHRENKKKFTNEPNTVRTSSLMPI